MGNQHTFDTLRSALGFETEAQQNERVAAERQRDVERARNLKRSAPLARGKRQPGTGPRIAR